ncbi:MAG TPA: transporter [Phenylobacterium sp.]|jgi:hypothetical protein
MAPTNPLCRTTTRRPRRAACTALFVGAIWAQGAQASEGGSSVYLLGSGGPGAAILPPIQGVFLANTLYYYDGKATGGKDFLLGGNLVTGLKAKITADFASVLWVPSTAFLGDTTLALGVALPVGYPDVNVSAVITGPLGNSFDVSRSQSAWIVGDPLVITSLGWKRGNVSVQASNLINIPAGDYRKGQLANLAFHRWADDFSLATTWHDDKVGWDVSGKAGLTFNGKNDATQYRTGTEFHLEGSVEKLFSPSFSAGLQAFYFDQVTGDSGSGAKLGEFKGLDNGIGLTGAYNFKIADKIPATLRLHALHEFNVRNRLEGNSVFLDFTMPLYVRLPPGAPAP